ncbi:MAG: hypothetical protein JWN27_3540 [Candidatus Eremiobacteraeota bacterium]|nr:hypothetical protein [Candidatus Eremiobacteraeota bacterium]
MEQRALQDQAEKARIEAAAVQHVIQRYTKRGFAVRSREPDNVGWDLEASDAVDTLCLEVKGSKLETCSPVLTPNEYAAARSHRGRYRVCIVTLALDKPKLSEIRWLPSEQEWVDGDNRIWNIDERTAARFSPAD